MLTSQNKNTHKKNEKLIFYNTLQRDTSLLIYIYFFNSITRTEEGVIIFLT